MKILFIVSKPFWKIKILYKLYKSKTRLGIKKSKLKFRPCFEKFVYKNCAKQKQSGDKTSKMKKEKIKL